MRLTLDSYINANELPFCELLVQVLCRISTGLFIFSLLSRCWWDRAFLGADESVSRATRGRKPFGGKILPAVDVTGCTQAPDLAVHPPWRKPSLVFIEPRRKASVGPSVLRAECPPGERGCTQARPRRPRGAPGLTEATKRAGEWGTQSGGRRSVQPALPVLGLGKDQARSKPPTLQSFRAAVGLSPSPSVLGGGVPVPHPIRSFSQARLRPLWFLLVPTAHASRRGPSPCAILAPPAHAPEGDFPPFLLRPAMILPALWGSGPRGEVQGSPGSVGAVASRRSSPTLASAPRFLGVLASGSLRAPRRHPAASPTAWASVEGDVLRFPT